MLWPNDDLLFEGRWVGKGSLDARTSVSVLHLLVLLAQVGRSLQLVGLLEGDQMSITV